MKFTRAWLTPLAPVSNDPRRDYRADRLLRGHHAFVLHRVVGTELLAAYLATSPGGLDAAAVIAASTHVDMPFVMGLQTVRLFVVLLLGPALARFMARRSRIDRVSGGVRSKSSLVSSEG